MKLRIMTYNISHGNDYSVTDDFYYVDLDKYADMIKRYSPQIVALQEVYDGKKPQFKDQTEQIKDKLSAKYSAYAVGATFPWGDKIGNAVLSSYPILNVERTDVPCPTENERDPDENEWYEDRAILKTTIDIGKKIDVITTHFGLNTSEKLRMEQKLTAILDTSGNPHILMGDFNANPHTEVLKPYYDRLTSAADVAGKTDVFTFAPFEPRQTIDYVFVSKEFKVLGYEVTDEVLSDHKAVIVELEID